MESADWTNHALFELHVRPVERHEEARYQAQMAHHHYLGALPKIGQTLWYVATWRDEWVAQLSLPLCQDRCRAGFHKIWGREMSVSRGNASEIFTRV